MSILSNKVILLTGGTGSFGRAFTKIALQYEPKVIRIYSRDEFKQSEMQREFNDGRLRFLLGDVRDARRLHRATNGVDIIVHTAAIKQVPVAEYNPIECIATNINGAVNIIDAAINNSVEKVIAISSDKACAPANLYGATKMVMEKLLVQANVYSKHTRFSCVRYGNVVGSRGSIIPVFKEQVKTGIVTITDKRMTRFWITLEQGVMFVLNCLDMMRGGEVFIPKIPSMRITDLIKIIAPNARLKEIGIRPGEKLHESLITEDEARHAKEFEDYFVIQPEFMYWTEDTYWDLTGNKLPENFKYSSNTNPSWLTKDKLGEILKEWI